jgi:hypothetical protein
MPLKKDYGPPTRRSQRLTTASEEPEKINQVDDRDKSKESENPEEEVNVIAEGTEPEEPARLELGENREQDTPFPSIEEEEDHESEDYDSAPASVNLEEAADQLPLEQEEPNLYNPAPFTMPGNDNNDNQLAAMERLLQRVAQLEAREEPERSTRGVTPANSAFGGSDFKPVGFAALLAFKPFGDNQKAKNAAYDRKARETRRDPGIFEGDKDLFDDWIIKLADKCEEDLETFKTERSRMALVYSLTNGQATKLLKARYSSSEIPFKNTAEMIATLSAVFHDDNQASKAREELRNLEYNPADKELDIHQFIGKVNGLADTAGIGRAERKTVLYEHIPADLDLRLLRDSKDTTISYEDFAGAVADAATAKQRSYDKRVEKKQARRNQSPPTDHSSRNTDRSSRNTRRRSLHSKEVNAEAKSTSDNPVPVSERKKAELKADGKCFLCQKEGHIARYCPQKKAIAAVLADLDKEDSDETDSDISSEQSEN